MADSSLDQLVAAGLLQAKAPDPDRVRRWLARSERIWLTFGSRASQVTSAPPSTARWLCSETISGRDSGASTGPVGFGTTRCTATQQRPGGPSSSSC